jgi:hypothetical protein
MAMEAVTVNPTQDKSGVLVPPPATDTPEQKTEFLRSYMPIKFGSALSNASVDKGCIGFPPDPQRNPRQRAVGSSSSKD